MGIQDLSRIIKDNCFDAYETRHLSTLSGKRIAVDISIYLHRYVKSVGAKDWIYHIVKIIYKMQEYNIIPIFIFDGVEKPVEKQIAAAERSRSSQIIEQKVNDAKLVQQKFIDSFADGDGPNEELINDCKIVINSRRAEDATNYEDADSVLYSLNECIISWSKQLLKITSQQTEQAKEIIAALGYNSITAKGEAETMCCVLAKSGIVDAVLTEDTDVLAYGIRRMWRDLNLKEDTVQVINGRKVRESIVDGVELSEDSFRDFCILLSCDYNKRIRGFGPEKVRGLFSKQRKGGDGVQLTSIEEMIERGIISSDNAENIVNYRVCRNLLSIPKLEKDFRFPRQRHPEWKRVAEFLEKYPETNISLQFLRNIVWKEEISE